MCFATPQVFTKPSFWDLNAHGNHKTCMPTNLVTVAFDTQICVSSQSGFWVSEFCPPLFVKSHWILVLRSLCKIGFPISSRMLPKIVAICRWWAFKDDSISCNVADFKPWLSSSSFCRFEWALGLWSYSGVVLRAQDHFINSQKCVRSSAREVVWAYRVGQDPSDSKSNRLHVHIFRFWCFHAFEVYSIDSSKMTGKLPDVLDFNRFICN